MFESFAKLEGTPYEPVIMAIAALLLVGMVFFIFFRMYWTWNKKQAQPAKFKVVKRQFTLFDVRELLVQGQKDAAVRVYQQIFKVGQVQAQKAVDELNKNIHKQG